MREMNEYAIRVKNLYKDFKLNSDKPMTLKEKLVFIGKNKTQKVHILKDMGLPIDLVECVDEDLNGSGYAAFSPAYRNRA